LLRLRLLALAGTAKADPDKVRGRRVSRLSSSLPYFVAVGKGLF